MPESDAPTEEHRVTQLLHDARAGRDGAPAELLDAVYAQLRVMARSRMSSERDGHTLAPTELVHEAWLRLSGSIPDRAWEHRGSFFAACAEAMRRILIDYARKRNATKREGRHQRVVSDLLDLADDSDPQLILDLDEALNELEKEDTRLAKVARLRIFAGLSVEETAETLDVSVRTVIRDWNFARAWLNDVLKT